MANLPKFFKYVCPNPECRKEVRIEIPKLSGIRIVTCPYCGIRKKMNLKGLDAYVPDSNKDAVNLNQDFFTGTQYKVVCPHCNKARMPLYSEKAGKGALTCPLCKGRTMVVIKEKPLADSTVVESAQPKGVDTSAKPPVDLGDDFYTNTSYTVECPHCKDTELTVLQAIPGPGVLVCPRCKGRVKYHARKPTETIVKSETIQLFRGKLILLRRGWINKDYPLRDGKNIVGRYDESSVSDIAIKGDSSMSRQSVEIHVAHHDKGYSFKLTVRNSTNPVLHNNKPLSVGESISLNFGDSIILGKTKFRFDKDV